MFFYESFYPRKSIRFLTGVVVCPLRMLRLNFLVLPVCIFSNVNFIEISKILFLGLVSFGFALMDRFGPLVLMTKAAGAANQRYRPPRDPLTVRQHLCQLGSDVITAMCHKFDICRSTLIKETISNLFVKAANKGSLVQPYAQLFAKLVR